MKSMIQKIGKLFFLCVSVLSVLSFAACDKEEEEEMGKFEPMKWQQTDYLTTEDNETTRYVVPSEGGSFTFTCKNYDSLRLSQIKYERDGESRYRTSSTDESFSTTSASDEICDISVDGNIVEITSKPNTDSLLKIDVILTHAHAFGKLCFVQEGNTNSKH